jgi:hypothetical protein
LSRQLIFFADFCYLLLSFVFSYFLAFFRSLQGMFCGHGFCLFWMEISQMLGFLWKKNFSIAYGRHPWVPIWVPLSLAHSSGRHRSVPHPSGPCCSGLLAVPSSVSFRTLLPSILLRDSCSRKLSLKK